MTENAFIIKSEKVNTSWFKLYEYWQYSGKRYWFLSGTGLHILIFTFSPYQAYKITVLYSDGSKMALRKTYEDFIELQVRFSWSKWDTN